MGKSVEKTKYTPPELARLWGIEPGKIIAWIRQGELRAIDASTRRDKRPRFLIDVADVADFERRRAVVPKPEPAPRRKRSAGGVKEYF